MILNRLFHIINQISPVIIQTPWVGTIGNCAEEIYFGLLRARREQKKVFFLFPIDLFRRFYFSKQGKGINSELIKIESSYRFLTQDHILSVLGTWCLTGIYCLFRIFILILHKFFKSQVHDSYITPSIGQKALWTPEGVTRFDRQEVEEYNWKQQMNDPLDASISSESLKKARKIRNQMGIPESDWFVCLHVREGGYYDYIEGKAKRIRNCDINNYFKAIDYITQMKGWVVRMGDATMKPLPVLERVIDYPHTSFKSDLMDIYLIQECRFYIGSQSGIWDVATLFQKPIMMPNMCEWLFTYPQRKGDLGLMKHIYSRSKKRFLSLRECQDIFRNVQFDILFDNEHEFYENTPDEILTLVKEYLEDAGTGHVAPLQENWNQRRIADGYHILENTIQSEHPDDDMDAKYRFSSRLEGCDGAMSLNFLNQNMENDILNTENSNMEVFS